MKDKQNQECLKVGGEGRSDTGEALGSSSAEPSTAPWEGVGLGEMLKLRGCHLHSQQVHFRPSSPDSLVSTKKRASVNGAELTFRVMGGHVGKMFGAKLMLM